MNWGGDSGSGNRNEQYRAAFGNVGTPQQSPYRYMIQTRTTGSSFDPFGRSSSSSTNPTHQMQSLPAETIKAITTDPSFQSALATALSSIIGGDLKMDNVTKDEAGKSP